MKFKERGKHWRLGVAMETRVCVYLVQLYLWGRLTGTH